jgi:hypothetical protein
VPGAQHVSLDSPNRRATMTITGALIADFVRNPGRKPSSCNGCLSQTRRMPCLLHSKSAGPSPSRSLQAQFVTTLQLLDHALASASPRSAVPHLGYALADWD